MRRSNSSAGHSSTSPSSCPTSSTPPETRTTIRAVWAGADELAMPLLGLSRRDYPLEAHLQAFTAHLVYGVTTEAVRRLFRRAL